MKKKNKEMYQEEFIRKLLKFKETLIKVNSILEDSKAKEKVPSLQIFFAEVDKLCGSKESFDRLTLLFEEQAARAKQKINHVTESWFDGEVVSEITRKGFLEKCAAKSNDVKNILEAINNDMDEKLLRYIKTHRSSFSYSFIKKLLDKDPSFENIISKETQETISKLIFLINYIQHKAVCLGLYIDQHEDHLKPLINPLINKELSLLN